MIDLCCCYIVIHPIRKPDWCLVRNPSVVGISEAYKKLVQVDQISKFKKHPKKTFILEADPSFDTILLDLNPQQ
jgi:hypothetical protein